MTSVPTSSSTRSATLSDLAYPAFLPPRMVFSEAPILFGLDKFANVLVPWRGYLAQRIDDLVPGSGQQAMYIVGVTEIVAGLVVTAAPRLGGWLVAA
jgi:hypothetical protein